MKEHNDYSLQFSLYTNDRLVITMPDLGDHVTRIPHDKYMIYRDTR